MQTHLFSRRPIALSMQDIDSLTKDSPIALLNALYQCQDFVFVDSTHNPSLNESNITKTFGYKSSFYLSFIANKDSLSNEYLEARKALYKTYQFIKQEQVEELQKQQQELEQELQGLDSKQRKSKLQELQREQRKRERQERFSNRNTANKDSYLILESKDKNNAIIFLDSTNSLSNLIHIHNNKIDIFLKDKSLLDIQYLESLIKEYSDNLRKSNNTEYSNQESKLTLDSLHSPNTQIFFYSILLNGGTESNLPYNECFFGELDSKSNFIESKPIYQLINKVDSSNTESNNTKVYNDKTDSNSIESKTHNKESSNTLSTLNIFLGSSSLTILNYSLLESSLNIKLECKSKESKEILDKEKQAKEAIESKESKIKDSTSLPTQSTALLHPILEDNELKCPHNGVVKLKSVKGKAFKSNNIPMILESDLINSPIIGCTNNIAGVPTPCTLVSTILPNARALKKYNNDYPIMQDLVASGVLSDKGFPIICTPKPNKFKINAPKPTSSNNQSKESIKSHIDTSFPSLRIITAFQQLDKFYLTTTYYENRESKNKLIVSQSNFYDTYKEIDIELDSIITNKNMLDSNNIESNQYLKDILDSLMLDYDRQYFSYRIFSIRIAYSIYEYLLIIPKRIPKSITQLLKEHRNKDELDYGYGSFIDLDRDYIRNIDSKLEGEVALDIQGKIMFAPSGCERFKLVVL